MKRSVGSSGVRRLFRLLVLLYSKPFRKSYGDEIAWAAAARWARARQERGTAGALVSGTRVAADLAWNGILERLQRGGSIPSPDDPAGDNVMLLIAASMRDAVRSLRREPAFAATILLTLAAGCGATLALFAIVDAALLRPLPYPAADRLFLVAQHTERFGLTALAPPFLRDLRERVNSFETLAGFSPSWSMTLTGAGEPRIVDGAYVTDGLFDLLGVVPRRGRAFLPAEHAAGGARVVVVSESFWERSVGVAARLDGHTIRLDGIAHEIVGILPDGFRLPIKDSAVTQGRPSANLWLPFALNPYADLRMVPVMNVIGRLRPDGDPAAAVAEIQTVGRTLARDYPDHARDLQATTVPLAEFVTARARSVVWPLFGAAVLVLLIACANVANLLLGRGASRRHELAVRASLGATRRRIMAQLLTESVVFAALGCTLGLLLAGWALAALPALGLEGMPPSADIRLDARVVLFTIAVTGLTAAASGLLPALRAACESDGSLLTAGPRVAGSSRRTWRGLVAAQAALALSLLAGAGLLARSFIELTRVHPGFRAEGILVVPVDLARRDPPARAVFLQDLFERLEQLPQVTAVSAVNRTPLSGSNVLVGVEIEGDPATAREPVPMDRRVAAPGYFEAMEIPFETGRDFGPADRPDSPVRAAVINRAAARFWPEGRAPGGRLRLMLQSGPGPWLTVVGVSGDVKHEGLDRPVRPEIYVPYAQAAVGSMAVLLRTTGDPLALISAVKAQVWALDADLPLDGVRPLTAMLDDALGEPRLRMLLLNAFATVAVLLAALGIYGVTAYSVARRTRDIGVRLALGARRADVLRLVLGEGLRPAVWGGAAGLLASFALTRALGDLLFGVTPFDPVAYLMAVIVLVSIAVVAAYFPARRAARIDPVAALRAD